MGCPKDGKLKLNNNKIKGTICWTFSDTLMIDCLIKFTLKPYEFGDVILIARWGESSERFSDLPKASLVGDGRSKNLDKGLSGSKCEVLSHCITHLCPASEGDTPQLVLGRRERGLLPVCYALLFICLLSVSPFSPVPSILITLNKYLLNEQLCTISHGKWKWTDIFVYKIFVRICYICKYNKVHLRLIFIKFICGIYRHLNKNKTITVPYDFWRWSTVWTLTSLFLPSLPAAGLGPPHSHSAVRLPPSIPLCPLFPKMLLLSYLLLLYIPLPLAGFPFSPSLWFTFLCFETILYLAQVCSLTPQSQLGPRFVFPSERLSCWQIV